LADLNVGDLYQCIDRSLDLFDRTYSSAGPRIGGWYHRLDSNIPGPSATAVAVHSYLLVNKLPARVTEALAFLKSRQVISSNKLISGGWSVNTSAGRPVLEATSLVVRLLGFGHLMVGSNAPDAASGYQWIVTNQNKDGGWGSFSGQPSRVWLTAMAIRALAEINLNDAAVASGVEWILRSRDPKTDAWGEQPQGPATITHTSFVLTCLVESQIGGQRPYVNDAVRKGFGWLQVNANTEGLYDDSARTESYNVSYNDGSQAVTWQNAVWHPSLPYTLSALVRHPDGGDPRLIRAAVSRILTSQSAEGRWPNADGSAGISVWSVWPFIDALSDFIHRSPVHSNDRITLLSESSILIRRGPDASASLARLAWKDSSANSIALLRRYWATVLFALTLIVGAALVFADVLDLRSFLLALVLPVALVAVQELMARTRATSSRHS
jgi:Prenyltransferase and squalene oxidase repeat